MSMRALLTVAGLCLAMTAVPAVGAAPAAPPQAPKAAAAPKPGPVAPPAAPPGEAMPVSTLRESLPPRGPIQPTVRIKDISRVESVRANQLVGYGIVTGLAGTGDSQQSPFTLQSVVAMLQRNGVNPDLRAVRTKNAAAVMVTAEIPAFAKNGSRIDVTISSIGDATSLQGGNLIQTPLLGADDKVYAVAQGPVSIGGFSAGGGGNSVTKNHPTTGRLAGGTLVEREIKTTLTAPDGSIKINLNTPDFENASRVAEAINTRLGVGTAVAEDAASIRVRPSGTDVVRLIAQIEDIRVQPSMPAKVVLNERTGTVVIGGAVRIAPVAVSHGSLTVEIQTEFQVSQPDGYGNRGKTTVVPQMGVRAEEERAAVVEFQPGTSLAELVRALNALRVTPRDIIAIIQALKTAGGLYAELEIQ